ncbi:MAG: hypothetical protein P8Y03_28850, partial [Anaerolineales bacterium]
MIGIYGPPSGTFQGTLWGVATATGSSYFKILPRELPQDELVNMGRGNETVPSLRGRLYRTRFRGHLDLAFLWVGVNDVTSKVTLVMRLLVFRPA